MLTVVIAINGINCSEIALSAKKIFNGLSLKSLTVQTVNVCSINDVNSLSYWLCGTRRHQIAKKNFESSIILKEGGGAEDDI